RGLITIKDIEKVIEYPNASKDDQGSLIVGAAVGVTGDAMKRIEKLVDAHVDVIVIDTAHGHSKGVLEQDKKVREAYPDLNIVASKVTTESETRDVIEEGVYIVKVVNGPGSISTNHIIAGIDVPQITAIHECSEEAAKYDVPIIADGRNNYSDDVVKALAAG